MKINNADGTIKYGNFDVKMFQPPINLRKRLQRDQLPNAFIKITIQMPEQEEPDDDEEAEAERTKQEEDRRRAAEVA